MLETVDDDMRERFRASWFSMAEQTWGTANHIFVQHGCAIVESTPPEALLSAHVLRRDLYVHVDAARVSNVPEEWTNSVTVIKFRLSGLKAGLNQLCPGVRPPPSQW